MIFTGIKGLTDTASWIMDEALKKILPNIPNLLLDTLEELTNWRNFKPPNNATGHIDVKSLYTNIPQDEGT